MRKTIAIITVAFLMVSVAGVHSGAVSFKNQEVVPYSEKIPIETPHFKPILDCVWDEDYQTKYIIKETEKLFHEGTYISTAWYENTLYFYLFVPDTSPQEEPYNIANYMADGPWFALYFGGDLRGKMIWKG
ncbi:MAG: hypothetical protein J5563_07640, partial [Clostridia bacterium]|nr:hypothetical protein [Clostridia bacterium]